jgi:hypothetical protein
MKYGVANGIWVLWSLSHKKLKIMTKWGGIAPPIAMEDYGL